MNSRLITIDISKQLTLDANRKAVQKISLINDLECNTDAAGNLVLVVDIYLKLSDVQLDKLKSGNHLNIWLY